VLDTNGVSKTAQLLTTSVARPVTYLRDALAGAFRRLERSRHELQLFLRDDDTDVVEDTLTILLDTCRRHRAAITLAAVPGKLTNEAAAFVRDRISADPELVEVHQHGWMHVNHEPDGKKCEFGPSRSFEQQLQDIAAGQARMQEMFGSTWFPGFTPPWNRCTEDTCRALEDLGFSALSTDAARRQTGECRLRQIPVTIDIYRWKGSPMLRPADEIIREMILQMEQRQTVGILLHHKIMDAAAFAFLDELLGEVCSYGVARFHTFRALATILEAQPAAEAR